MKKCIISCLALVAMSAAAQKATVTIDINKPTHKVSPTLFGIFLEDINLSVDGGLYPELVRNRSFEDADSLCFWQYSAAKGNAVVSKADLGNMKKPMPPLNHNNRQFLSVTADGSFSLANSGFWGMNIVQGEKYDFSIALRTPDSYKGSLKAKIVDKYNKVLADTEIKSVTGEWKYTKATLSAKGSATDARLIIEGNGKGELCMDMISLMPQKRWGKSGVRTDLGEALKALRPTFFRFPGGCWVEGEEIAQRYQWKNTVGPIESRIPLWNIWGYNATHGIGYHEYLQLAEDLGAEPLFCINAGVSHKEVIPSDQIDQWIQDALDAIEYANGPVTSVWGAARARNGHPEPFNMKYIEVGNENFGSVYFRNFELISNAIKARYPEMQIISNDWSGAHPTKPAHAMVDEHYYNNPDWFILNANKYDNRKRGDEQVFIGEYAVTSKCGKGNLRGAVGEAAFMTGLERNSDVVAMAAYAPLFCNVKHQRWPINLINYDNHRWYGLPSYYVQQMFAENQGTLNLPVSVEGCPLMDIPYTSGGIGLGTWKNSAEFKDLKVTTPKGKVLYQTDFSSNIDSWEKIGDGEWSVNDGVLRQSSFATGVTAFTGNNAWKEYVITLKARKLSGENGFQIYFHHQNGINNRTRWDIGGYGNSINEIKTAMDSESINYSIEEGRWYDIRLEVSPLTIKGYIDGKLVQQASLSDKNRKTICASAQKDEKTGDIIVKIVNAANKDIATTILLNGAEGLAQQAEATVLSSASSLDENSLDNPTKVVPHKEQVSLNGNRIIRKFSANSVTVLRIAQQ
ncbi:MAG: alpha-L-arabinofuranosidase C-terminal domain-containing protein [Prevotella sp.]